MFTRVNNHMAMQMVRQVKLLPTAGMWTHFCPALPVYQVHMILQQTDISFTKKTNRISASYVECGNLIFLKKNL